MRRKLLVLMLSSTAMFGQKPVIAPNGVVNAASLVQAPVAGHAIAPQSIASIFGQNLAAGTSVATFPLPMSLGGTSVTVGGVPAPLSFVSSNQLNIQVPRNLPLPPGVSGTGYVPENVVVTSAAGSSAAVSVDVYTYGPAIFTQDGSGCGAGAILNVKPDGSVSLNSQTNSASTGDYLEMFGTGFDVEPFSIPDGYPTPADNAAFSLGGGGLLDNTLSQGLIGKAPGLVGIDQINIPVPDGVREGCAVPVLTGAGGSRVRWCWPAFIQAEVRA